MTGPMCRIVWLSSVDSLNQQYLDNKKNFCFPKPFLNQNVVQNAQTKPLNIRQNLAFIILFNYFQDVYFFFLKFKILSYKFQLVLSLQTHRRLAP